MLKHAQAADSSNPLDYFFAMHGSELKSILEPFYDPKAVIERLSTFSAKLREILPYKESIEYAIKTLEASIADQALLWDFVQHCEQHTDETPPELSFTDPEAKASAVQDLRRTIEVLKALKKALYPEGPKLESAPVAVFE